MLAPGWHMQQWKCRPLLVGSTATSRSSPRPILLAARRPCALLPTPLPSLPPSTLSHSLSRNWNCMPGCAGCAGSTRPVQAGSQSLRVGSAGKEEAGKGSWGQEELGKREWTVQPKGTGYAGSTRRVGRRIWQHQGRRQYWSLVTPRKVGIMPQEGGNIVAQPPTARYRESI